MKAAVAGEPGKVRVLDFPEPELGDGELLLAPLACGICSTDVKLVKKGSENNKYALGHELAGEIVAVSSNSLWKVGQKVVAAPYLPCGACYYCQHNQPTLCTHLFETSILPGALSEKVRVPRDLANRGLIEIPAGMSPDIAALAEPVGCVIKGIEDSDLRPGNSILVIGDGPMGLISAAVARAYGAYPVMVAGMTPHRYSVAKEHYADVVIDVSSADLQTEVKRCTGDRGADVVMVAVSSPEALISGLDCARPGGTVNAFAGVPKGTTVNLDMRKLHYEQIYLTGSFGVAPVHLAKALNLFSSGRVAIEPLITARFSFESVVDAVKYAADRTGLKAVVTF